MLVLLCARAHCASRYVNELIRARSACTCTLLSAARAVAVNTRIARFIFTFLSARASLYAHFENVCRWRKTPCHQTINLEMQLTRGV